MEPESVATSRKTLVDAAGQPTSEASPLRGPSTDGMTPLLTPGYIEPASRLARPLAGQAALAPHANGHANGHLSSHTYLALAQPPHVAGVQALHGHAHVLTHVGPLEANSFYFRFGKRAIDIMGSVLALILCAPVMLLLAIIIKLESTGPVLYRSTRIGRNGRPFTFYKLRSMVDGADRHREHLEHLNEQDGPVFKISHDPRITRIGRFLRTTSIDEIPQFINVLRGEMSLVGPRPPIPEEVAQYEPWQMRRLDVRPGITCLWQISGRSRIGFKEWMRLDLEYIKHRSFWLDLRILLRTIPAVLSREGAY